MKVASRRALGRELELKSRAPKKRAAKKKALLHPMHRAKLAEINEELQELHPPKTVTLTADQIKYVNPHTFVELGAKLRHVREVVESWDGKTHDAWLLMRDLRKFFGIKEGKRK